MKRYDPHENELGYLQDLAASFWSSEVLYSALAIGIFDLLKDPKTLEETDQVYGGKTSIIKPLLSVLTEMGFLSEYEGTYCNTPLSNKYLVKETPLYLGEFLSWMEELGSEWKNLTKRLKGPGEKKRQAPSRLYRSLRVYYERKKW